MIYVTLKTKNPLGEVMDLAFTCDGIKLDIENNLVFTVNTHDKDGNPDTAIIQKIDVMQVFEMEVE